MTGNRNVRANLILLSLLTVVGCADDGGGPTPSEGALTVLLEPEDALIEGLEAGDGEEMIQDGWSVTFDRYLITVGAIDVHLSTDEAIEAEGEDIWVADLSALPATGIPLWTVEGLSAGRWEFFYATPGAADGSAPHESVAVSDHDAMLAEDWTYLIDATMTHPTGQSCPPASLANPGAAEPNGNTNARGEACYDNPTVSFEWGVTAETTFGPCEVDEIPGFAMPEGGNQTVAATIHGDHLFFNGFPEGAESGARRFAQWIADSDLDLDGTVTREELEAITPSDLAEIDDRYALGGAPVELTSMWAYLIGQLKTQGHFQGEGECPFDGVAHDH